MFDASTDLVTDFDTGDNVNVIDTAGNADITGVKVRGLELTTRRCSVICVKISVRFCTTEGHYMIRV